MRWMLCSLLLVATASFALDPNRPLADFSLQAWNTDQGLPHDAVIAMAQTEDGYLWAGTWDGLVRFNGAEFRNFTSANTPALKDNGVLALYAGKNNTLWVGTHRGGLARLRDGQWEAISDGSNGAFSHVLAILEDKAGTLWIGTEERGFFSFRDNVFSRFGRADGLPSDTVSALYQTRDGRLLIGTANGLAERTADGFRRIVLPTTMANAQITAIREDTEGRLLIATDRGLTRFVFTNSTLSSAELIYHEAVSQLYLDRSNAIWIASQERGILRLVGTLSAVFGVEEGLPNTRISAMLEDRDGDLWIATNGGLARLQDKAFSSLTKRRGLSDDYVRAVAQSADGSIWIGTSAGLNLIRDGQLKRLDPSQSLVKNSILALAPMPDNTLWIGGYSTGVSVLGGKNPSARDRDSGLPGNQVRAILRARDGSVYVGTDRGLAHIVDGELQLLTRSQSPGHFIMSLHQTADGAIWIGSSNGASRIFDGETTRFGDAQGLAAQNIFSFLSDEEGTLWLGTDSGLYRYRDGQFQRIDQTSGLPDNTVFAVLDDGIGYFWMSSNHGVFRIDKAHANAIADGRLEKLDAYVFGRSDGMASSQCNGGSQPAALRLQDGRLAFATARGVAFVDPARLKLESEKSPPTLAIEDILIEGVAVPLQPRLEIKRDQRRIDIRFGAISFREPERVRYRHRLLGLQSQWSQPTTERSAVFGNLAPGNYQFEVQAAFLDGPWSASAPALALTIQPRFYETQWFLLALALTLIALGALVNRIRLRQLRLRTLKLEALVSERTQALEIEKGRLETAMSDKLRLLGELESQSARFEQLAREDGLTGLFNRRYFDALFEQVFDHALKKNTALTVAIADLDHFKQINDEFSHRVGDEVLRRFAWILQQHLRDDDVCARYGGEEFVLLLPGLNASTGRAVCEQIRVAVAAFDWRDLHPDLKVSVSFGLSDRMILNHREKLLSDADAQLYQAKRGGRNRVCA